MSVQSIFTALDISASGLRAQRKKLDAISSNIANANTTRTETGEPYRRKVVELKAVSVVDFDSVLRKRLISLQNSDQRHIPFNRFSQKLSNNYNKVEASVEQDQSDFLRVYDPSHPDADDEGYVLKPNINVVSEMVDMISASRAYEANLSSIEAAKEMARRALEI